VKVVPYLIEGVCRMNDPAFETLREREEGGEVRQTRARDGSPNHPRASEVLDAVLRAVVFTTLGVVPFDPEPGSRRAANRTDELDRSDVS
jgi:hypothetical protein